jgi:hypothetical protein
MNYWPFSTIRNSPLMPACYQYEIDMAPRTCQLSPLAFQACGDVAERTPPRAMPNLAIVETIDGPARQVFTDYPSFDEWLALERCAVIEGSYAIHIIIDATH